MNISCFIISVGFSSILCVPLFLSVDLLIFVSYFCYGLDGFRLCIPHYKAIKTLPHQLLWILPYHVCCLYIKGKNHFVLYFIFPVFYHFVIYIVIKGNNPNTNDRKIFHWNEINPCYSGILVRKGEQINVYCCFSMFLGISILNGQVITDQKGKYFLLSIRT